MNKIPKIILLFFLLIFIFKGLQNLKTIPFHDFDEANRAEGAKNMKRYHFYLAPLTGSPFHRVENLKIKAKNNPQLSIYYHLERPPFFYWLMIASTLVFKENEFAYRLPSFIFGLLIILIFILFFNVISALAIILSFDLWLSSQQALMDTTLTFFLFLAFLFLFKFLKTKKTKYLIFSSIFYSVSFLTKGQMAFIFIFPLIFAFFYKKIKLKQLGLFGFFSFLIVFPWFFLLVKKFGVMNFFYIFINFAKKRALEFDPTQQAPFFWYVRLFFDNFRLGWVLFFSLLIDDIVKRKLNFEKLLVLFYFFSSFFLFSFSKNKVWWYVLPLVPVVCFYIHLSTSEKIKNQKSIFFNFHLIILVASFPFFYHQRNIIALFLFILYVILAFLILQIKFYFSEKKRWLGIFSLVFALIVFYFNFPQVIPYYEEVKKIGEYYKKLPQPKCLYVENMPYEAALFYTDAEEINYLHQKTKLKKSCQNYLLTADNKNLLLIFKEKRLKIFKL